MAKDTINDLSGYDLSRRMFDFAFENNDLVRPVHIAMYFFAIEHCNRLGWKAKFGLPSTMVMEAIGVKSYNTYKNALDDLVEWGFIIMVEKSKNQYSSNIIALSKFNKANNKALDKALSKHSTKHTPKQSESTVQSIDSIDKQETIEQVNNKPLNNKPVGGAVATNIHRFEFLMPEVPEKLIAVSGFYEAWTDFVEHRKEIKKPMTEKAARDSLSFLENQPDPVEVIRASIRNGWQGLFKQEQKNESKRNTIHQPGSRSTAVAQPSKDFSGRL